MGEPGATLKMYDDDWFGNAVTVVEMDGEIDMDNMEAQLKEIEENMEGLNAKSANELTEAMVKLKSSPGSQNGTGMLQTVIAMKVREIYEKLGLQVACAGLSAVAGHFCCCLFPPIFLRVQLLQVG